MKFMIAVALVALVCLMYSLTLPAPTIENPDVKLNLAMGSLFALFLSLAGIIGGEK